jgi:tRNA dimethylallyltransferase
MINEKKKVIFIYGPTASGKSDFAEKLAAQIPAEIINMDSAQIYTPLTIGTAKPDLKKSPIKQHLFDIKDHPENLTVHAYRELVQEKINEIHKRKHIPILVGGSGFYLKALLFRLVSGTVPENKVQFNIDIPEQDMWERLKEIDPERALSIHPNDYYRIKRALEIWFVTGKKPSEYKPIYDPVAPFVLVHVTREKKELYRRIDKRVVQMVQAGWLDEAKKLLGTPWELFVQEKGIIGYAEIIGYLKHVYDLQQATEMIAQRTRNYAKRQETFWRMLKKIVVDTQKENSGKYGKITEFDLTYPDNDLYIKQLLDDVLTLDCGDYESN